MELFWPKVGTQNPKCMEVLLSTPRTTQVMAAPASWVQWNTGQQTQLTFYPVLEPSIVSLPLPAVTHFKRGITGQPDLMCSGTQGGKNPYFPFLLLSPISPIFCTRLVLISHNLQSILLLGISFPGN